MAGGTKPNSISCACQSDGGRPDFGPDPGLEHDHPHGDCQHSPRARRQEERAKAIGKQRVNRRTVIGNGHDATRRCDVTTIIRCFCRLQFAAAQRRASAGCGMFAAFVDPQAVVLIRRLIWRAGESGCQFLSRLVT